MINQVFARGAFLVIIALFFMLQSPALVIGSLVKPGPGLFPMLVSGLLLAIGIAIIVRARFVDAEPFSFKFRNVALIAASLVAFVAVTERINMVAGIAVMITIALLASDAYSLRRNIVVVATLCLVAFGMKRFLGVQLPLL